MTRRSVEILSIRTAAVAAIVFPITFATPPTTQG